MVWYVAQPITDETTDVAQPITDVWQSTNNNERLLELSNVLFCIHIFVTNCDFFLFLSLILIVITVGQHKNKQNRSNIHWLTVVIYSTHSLTHSEKETDVVSQLSVMDNQRQSLPDSITCGVAVLTATSSPATDTTVAAAAAVKTSSLRFNACTASVSYTSHVTITLGTGSQTEARSIRLTVEQTLLGWRYDINNADWFTGLYTNDIM